MILDLTVDDLGFPVSFLLLPSPPPLPSPFTCTTILVLTLSLQTGRSFCARPTLSPFLWSALYPAVLPATPITHSLLAPPLPSLRLCPRWQSPPVTTPTRVRRGPPPLPFPRLNSLLILRSPLRLRLALMFLSTIRNSEPSLAARLNAICPTDFRPMI